MNRAIRRIPLQHQAAAALRIVRVVLDHDGGRNAGDDVANLYIVRCQLLGSVERDSYFVACHQRLDAVEGVGHERCRDSPRRILLHETTRGKWPKNVGAGLDPDGSQQVWFRITAASVGRMREKTPHGRGDRLGDTLLAWLAPGREIEPGINRFQVRVWQDGNPWIEPHGGGSR